MSAQGTFVEELMKEGLKFINVTLDTGQNVTLVYGEHAFEKMANFTAERATWAYDNPLLIVCGIGAAGLAVAAVCPGCVSVPALSYIGFTTEGVKAESAAAYAHSWIGNVVSGSKFAILQSAGTGGTGLAIVNSLVQKAGSMAVSGAVSAWMGFRGNTTAGCRQEDGVMYCHSQ